MQERNRPNFERRPSKYACVYVGPSFMSVRHAAWSISRCAPTASARIASRTRFAAMVVIFSNYGGKHVVPQSSLLLVNLSAAEVFLAQKVSVRRSEHGFFIFDVSIRTLHYFGIRQNRQNKEETGLSSSPS